MKFYEITGTYGSQQTPCTVFVGQTPRGCWYCVEGGSVVNFTTEFSLKDGTDVGTLQDIDCFTWSGPITTLESFKQAILD